MEQISSKSKLISCEAFPLLMKISQASIHTWSPVCDPKTVLTRNVQMDAQVDRVNKSWNVDAQDFRVPGTSGRATPALNASAPQFVPPSKLPVPP